MNSVKRIPGEKVYVQSIFMNLDAITIKFALDNHFIAVKLENQKKGDRVSRLDLENIFLRKTFSNKIKEMG